jgi:hypothetical protein
MFPLAMLLFDNSCLLEIKLIQRRVPQVKCYSNDFTLYAEINTAK